jgi:dienelactone hydrolase
MRRSVHQEKAIIDRRGKPLLAMVFGSAFLGLTLVCILSLMLALIISVTANAYLAWNIRSNQAAVAQTSAAPTDLSAAEPRATLDALATQVAALSQSTVSPTTERPTPAAPSVSGTPTPVSRPMADYAAVSHPMADYTIRGLRERTYLGGTLRVRSVLTVTDVFTRYYIDYPSDELTITGIMQVPPGDGPFPVVILNHGYIPRDRYWPGADTWKAAQYLNRRGYLTIAPDFRSWGESDTGNSFFSTGQVIDSLNLVSSLSSIPEADPGRVGMWGHSMGGGVTTKAITIDPRIQAAVLYAPVSADDAEVLARWGTGCKPGPSGELDDECAGAEVLTSGMDEKLYLAYLEAVSNPELLYLTSPINYLDWVVAPVQIHIGTADTRTPLQWSAAIHQALRDADKEAEYFTYAGQGHAFQGEHWRLFMERVADFFDRHVKDTH